MRRRNGNNSDPKPVCPKCNGTKMICLETRKVNCSTCKGKGRNPNSTWDLCVDCKGRGRVDAEYYSRCRICLDD